MMQMQKIDEMIVLFFQGIRPEIITRLFNAFIPVELFWIVVAVIIALFSFFRSRVLRFPIVSFILARVFSDHFFPALKEFFHRPRPFLTIKGAVPLITVDGFSLPSGHATLSMATAVVLAFHFPRMRGLSYAFAFLVGFSRIYFGVHYLSDVLAGFVLGYALGRASIFLEQLTLSFTKGVDLSKKTSL